MRLSYFTSLALSVSDGGGIQIQASGSLVPAPNFRATTAACFYSIPFFIYYAIGVDLKISNLFYIIAMCSFALTISVWVPTPGASGGAELAFTTLFSGLMIGYDDPQNLAMSGMLIWRLLTYYFLMIYGLFNYLLFERRARYEDRIIH